MNDSSARRDLDLPGHTEIVPTPSVHAVLITFRRPDDLRLTLSALSAQTRQPETLVVVDNDPAQSARMTAVESGATTYVATGDNLGPAGGLAAGVADVLARAADEDWVLFLDDDDPPQSATEFEDLYTYTMSLPPDVGAIGLVGARYDRRFGRIVRLDDKDLHGDVEVDCIGGNQFGMYRVAALRVAGVPDASLFFGFDDLQYGLRVRSAGWRILVDGDRWAAVRAFYGRRSASSAQLRSMITPPNWRGYYTNRNLIAIARQHGGPFAVIGAATMSLGRATQALTHRRWRYALSILRGIFDGLRGRSGRTVDPRG